MKRTTYIFSILIGLGALGLVPLSAQAETTECTVITSLPYQINTQGVYCLKSKLSTGMITGNAIEIMVNNVTLDLNGYALGGLAAGTGTTTAGIFASGRQNITIRNGVVRGFYRGIYITGGGSGGGHLVEDILADKNRFVGIQIAGNSSTIQNCKAVDTGGSTNTLTAYGIYLSGHGGMVLNNIVSGLSGTGVNYGINIAPAALAKGNTISIVTAPGTSSDGIYVSSALDAAVVDNIIRGPFTRGIRYTGSSTGIYRGNIISGAITPFTGGTPAPITTTNHNM